jgi:hypothetical protein
MTLRRPAGAVIVAGGMLAGLCLIGAGVHGVQAQQRAFQRGNETGYSSGPTQAERTAPTLAERTAGCTGVLETARVARRDHRFGRINYATVPPNSGPHNPYPLPAATRYYPITAAAAPERAVHNLEHGYVVIWFDRRLNPEGVSALRTLTTQFPRLVVVGWANGVMPGAHPVALTAWQRSEACSVVSADVVQGFYRRHHDDRHVAPEAGGLGGPALAPNMVKMP